MLLLEWMEVATYEKVSNRMHRMQSNESVQQNPNIPRANLFYLFFKKTHLFRFCIHFTPNVGIILNHSGSMNVARKQEFHPNGSLSDTPMHLRIKEVSYCTNFKCIVILPGISSYFMSCLALEFWGPWQRSGKTSFFPGGGPFQPCNPHELCRTLENDGKHAFQISRLATIKCQLTLQVTQLGFPTAKRTTPTAFACLALSSSCVPADPRHLWDLWDLATTRHKPHIPPIHLAYLLVSSDKLCLSADFQFWKLPWSLLTDLPSISISPQLLFF